MLQPYAQSPRFARRFGRLARRLRGAKATSAKRSRYSDVVLGRQPVSRSIKDYIHYFERTDTKAAINESGAATNFGSYQFTFSEATGYLEMQALFGFYKIMKIKITFMPFCNSNAIVDNNAANYLNQPIFACVDTNNATTPVSTNEVLEQSNVHTWSVCTQKTITWTPHILRMVYQSAIATSYESVPATTVWLDTANDSVPHYGIKYFWYNTNAGNGKAIMFPIVTYTIACKNPK